MEAHIAFHKKPFDRTREVELPESLPLGFIGEIVNIHPGSLTLKAVKYFGVDFEINERIEPPIELATHEYACAPGGNKIGVYDDARRLTGVYQRDDTEEPAVWRPQLSTPMSELPEDIRDALAVLARRGREHGIVVTHRSDARGEQIDVVRA